MSTLQIVLLSVAGGFALLSIIFMILFIVEISVEAKEVIEETEVKSVFSSDSYTKNDSQESVSIDTMLAKLDEQAEENKNQNITVNVVIESNKNEEATVEETAEAPAETVVEETAEVPAETVVEETAEVPAETVVEETAEVPAEEAVVEETTETPAEETKNETVINQSVVNNTVVNEVIVQNSEQTISAANVLDYKTRLEKVIENKEKINKDLVKIEKSILNYERTLRRKIRNQKLLDRRASELTNLNLVMYSVTDIKNVDEDKKAKQEELTSHISELKASIQDAEEFLESNKEKNEHDVKMAKFLIQEKTRYTEEITELEKLIAKTEDVTTVA